MAFDLSKLNFFSKLDAKARVLVLIGGLAGMVFLVYLVTRMLSGPTTTVGPSRVASAPRGLQSVPGGQQTPEFSKAVEQANAQRAEQATITGESAIPTLVNLSQPQGASGSCVICAEQTPSVQNKLDDWMKQGKITPDAAKELSQLADKKVSVEEYAAVLAQMVKDGKITPTQARELLDTYTAQYAGGKLNESAQVMDDMIKSGVLPLAAANELLQMQKAKVSTAEYAAKLQEMVTAGKITPATAQKLLAQYTQQKLQQGVAQRVAMLHEMAAKGEITPDVEATLAELEKKSVPVDTYAAELDRLVAQGKITPAVAKKLLDSYKAQKAEIGPSSAVDELEKQAEAAAFGELSDLLKAGKITQDVADTIGGMIQQNVSLNDFTNAIGQLVQQNKLTPDIAKLKVADYKAVRGYRELAAKLHELQGNNASGRDYADILKVAVQSGLLSPQQATQLMRQYQAVLSKGPTVTAGQTNLSTPAGAEFAKLQQRLQKGVEGAATPGAEDAEFEEAQTQGVEVSTQDQAQQIQNLMQVMSGQAQQLISSWQPPTMSGKVATADNKTAGGAAGSGAQTGAEGAAGSSAVPAASLPVLVKAGTIQFAVLDTEANSDYPNSPIMATIVEGKLKGAKLLGKLQTTKGVAGQMDRITLQFTLMNMDAWDKSKSITAYAIDPDTARTVLASSVNYHYMQRFGAMMATSFLQGYSSALTSSGGTTTTGIFGTSSTNPELSPSSKFMVGLGQVGQTLGKATQNYANLPPTVRVDSGVGLGILFMSDVS